MFNASRLIITSAAVALTGIARTEFTDAQAISKARLVLAALDVRSILGTDVSSISPIVENSNLAPVGRPEKWHRVVYFRGAITCTFDAQGNFFSYSDSLGTLPGEAELDLIPTDEAAWTAAERAIADTDKRVGLALPAGLQRNEIRNSKGPAEVIAYFGPRPYGYKAWANRTTVGLHPRSGRVLTLTVSRGWTFEPPDIRTTVEQAIAAAIAKRGGTHAQWKWRLEYTAHDRPTTLPELRELYAQKRMRLQYNLWSDFGATALVDTVTGIAYHHTGPEDWSQMHEAGKGGSESATAATSVPGSSTGPTASQSQATPIWPWAAGAAGLSVIIAAILIRRR